MLDFGATPPEINSGRMYLGPGSAPMQAAAAAWDALATELSITAIGCGSIVSELIGNGWRGPTSVIMSTAVSPYLAWLNTTATQTAETAAQARAAAAAYEIAFTMTVPPVVIAANRSLLLTLVATNFFGQNTAAIAATEAHYGEMWVQDAIAMYLYAESSTAASKLPQFTQPAQTADPTGPAGHSGIATDAATAAVQHGAASPLQVAAPGAVQQLGDQLASAVSSPLVQLIEHVPNVTNSVLSSANAVTSGRGIYIINMRLAAQEAAEPSASPALGGRLVAADASRPSARISVGVGSAGLVGKLSTPPSWAVAAPEIRMAAMELPIPTAGTIPTASAGADLGSGSIFSQSVLGTLSRDGPTTTRHQSKPIIVRSPAAG